MLVLVVVLIVAVDPSGQRNHEATGLCPSYELSIGDQAETAFCLSLTVGCVG